MKKLHVVADGKFCISRDEKRGTVNSKPCQEKRCRYHLLYEDGDRGAKPLSPIETCTLDIAEATDGVTLEFIGELFDLSRERVRQIEELALNKIRFQSKGTLALLELSEHEPTEARRIAKEYRAKRLAKWNKMAKAKAGVQ